MREIRGYIDSLKEWLAEVFAAKKQLQAAPHSPDIDVYKRQVHEPIIDRADFETVQRILENAPVRRPNGCLLYTSRCV